MTAKHVMILIGAVCIILLSHFLSGCTDGDDPNDDYSFIGTWKIIAHDDIPTNPYIVTMWTFYENSTIMTNLTTNITNVKLWYSYNFEEPNFICTNSVSPVKVSICYSYSFKSGSLVELETLYDPKLKITFERIG